MRGYFHNVLAVHDIYMSTPSLDLYFWYNSAFGSPLSRALGIGYTQELIARLTHTPISVHNSSTNSTLDNNPTTFPLNDSLYVDATHEVVILNGTVPPSCTCQISHLTRTTTIVITALNLSNFAATGPLPADHIPQNHSFVSSQLAPFASNMQFQSPSQNTFTSYTPSTNSPFSPLMPLYQPRSTNPDRHQRRCHPPNRNKRLSRAERWDVPSKHFCCRPEGDH